MPCVGPTIQHWTCKGRSVPEKVGNTAPLKCHNKIEIVMTLESVSLGTSQNILRQASPTPQIRSRVPAAQQIPTTWSEQRQGCEHTMSKATTQRGNKPERRALRGSQDSALEFYGSSVLDAAHKLAAQAPQFGPARPEQRERRVLHEVTPGF